MDDLEDFPGEAVQPKRKLSRSKRAKENSPPGQPSARSPSPPRKAKDAADEASAPFSPSGQPLQKGSCPSPQRGKRLMLPSRTDAEKESNQEALSHSPLATDSTAGNEGSLGAERLSRDAASPAAELPGAEMENGATGIDSARASESAAESEGEADSDAPSRMQSMQRSVSEDGSNAEGAQEDYWDEEDELGDLIKRQGTRGKESPEEEMAASDSGSDTASRGKGHYSEASDHDSDSDEENGQSSPANNQRALREAAQRDCIGKGEAPEIQPLTGVLARIKMRAAAAAQRAAMTTRTTIPSPPPRSFAHASRPAVSDDDDLIIEADDDYDDGGLVPITGPTLEGTAQTQLPTIQVDALAGITKMSDIEGEGRVREAMQLRLVLDSETQQEEIPMELEPSLQNASGLRVVLPSDEAATCASGMPLVTPALPWGLGDRTNSEWDRITTSSDKDRSHWAPRRPNEDSSTDKERRESGLPELQAPDHAWPPASGAYLADSPCKAEQGHVDPRSERSKPASPPEGTEGGLAREDEEDDLSAGSSSSSDSDPEAESEEEDAEEEERRRQEDLALLRDRPKKKKERQLFEDEAEMSEDEGHSEDDDDDDDDEQEELLKGLIGHEKDRKGDEKRRRALHAEWLAEKEEQQVQEILHGVRHGFRSRKGPAFLQDDDGTLGDARRRRAALAEQEDSDDGSTSASDSDEDEAEIGVADLDDQALDALSDDEAKEELRRYQAQKLLDESQETLPPELLDGDSQAMLDLLGSLDSAPVEPAPAPKPVKENNPSRFGSTANITKKSTKATKGSTFRGLISSVPAAMAARAGSQNTRSFVFGREDSNSAPTVEGEETEPARIGPTSFAGFNRTVAANPVEASRALRGSTSGLLGMLKPSKEVADGQIDGSAPLNLAGVLEPTKGRPSLKASRH